MLHEPIAGSPTLADVVEAHYVRFQPPDSCTSGRDVCSSLRTFARAIERDIGDVPANPAWMRERLKDFTPAMAGLLQERWSNVQNHVRFALEHTGMTGKRHLEPLSPVWAALYARLPVKPQRTMKMGLLRFCRHCSARGLPPEDVSDSVLDDFRQHLEDSCSSRDPRESHRVACKYWNMAADTIEGWPTQRVTVPDYRTTYIVPWTTFPATLKDDVDKYFDHLAGTDIFAERDFKPLQPEVRSRTKGFLSA